MNKDEILALLAEELPGLLKPSIDTLLGDVSKFMNEQIAPISDQIKVLSQPKVETKVETKTTKEQLKEDNDPVLARVKLLEQQLEVAAKDKEAQDLKSQDLRFNEVLSKEIDKASPMYKGVVSELLATRLRKDAKETDLGWLANGKNLSENVNAFFESPEGQHFLPSKHQNGVGIQETKAPKAGSPIDMDAELRAAFL